MALSVLDFIILAVVAFKVTVALLFLRWLATEPKKTGDDGHSRMIATEGAAQAHQEVLGRLGMQVASASWSKCMRPDARGACK